MRNKAVSVGLCFVAVIAFGYLINDALVFALSPGDPISGRMRGCYTLIEHIVGVLEPSDTLRKSQLCVGLIGAMIACGCLVRVLASRTLGRGDVRHRDEKQT